MDTRKKKLVIVAYKKIKFAMALFCFTVSSLILTIPLARKFSHIYDNVRYSHDTLLDGLLRGRYYARQSYTYGPTRGRK